MSKDKMLRALAFNGQVRIFVLNAKETIEEARKRHDMWHTSTAAMGRTIIGTLFLAANLKGNDQIAVRVDGSGPIGNMTIHGDTHGHVRGTIANPHVALPLNDKGKLDVSGGVGLPGTLSVSKYIEDMDPFTGQVPLVSGEIAEDFTYYMAASEQTPSSFGLSVLVDQDESVLEAGGFFIQVMPDAAEETIVALENQIGKLGRFSDLLRAGYSLEALLQEIVGENEYQILTYTDVNYYCPCSKEYYGEKLEIIDPLDLRAMIDEDQGAEVVCHYCGNKYQYNVEELEAIYTKATSN